MSIKRNTHQSLAAKNIPPLTPSFLPFWKTVQKKTTVHYLHRQAISVQHIKGCHRRVVARVLRDKTCVHRFLAE